MKRLGQRLLVFAGVGSALVVLSSAAVALLGGGFWLLIALLSAPHAEPTGVRNATAAEIQFRWRDEREDDWSALFDIPAGTCLPLPRAYYVADFVGVEVSEGGRTYTLADQELAKLRQACSKANFDPIASSGQCEVIYLGAGRFRARSMDQDTGAYCKEAIPPGGS